LKEELNTQKIKSSVDLLEKAIFALHAGAAGIFPVLKVVKEELPIKHQSIMTTLLT